jgi:hypothetical protein
MKKDHPFLWTPNCTKALTQLIDIILDNPSITQPDLKKPFSLQVDTSAFATGAILTQKDKQGKQLAVVTFFLLSCAYLMDYHWDHLCHLTYFPHHAQTMTHTPLSNDSILVHLLVVSAL